jgi:hypothetical protein
MQHMRAVAHMFACVWCLLFECQGPDFMLKLQLVYLHVDNTLNLPLGNPQSTDVKFQ